MTTIRPGQTGSVARVRDVIAPDSFGQPLSSAAAATAIAEGWRQVAPCDQLYELPLPDGCAGISDALDSADLVLTGQASFDWRSLRDTPVTLVARAAAERGLACLVLAASSTVGRREAASVGVEASYSVAEQYGGPDPAAVPAGALAELAATVAVQWSGSR